MKIQREVNGQMMEFELTSGELFAAYCEQEHQYDVSDIRDKLEGEMDRGEFEAEYGFPVELVLDNPDLLEEMADEKRRNQDKYDMDWEYARDDAIKSIIDEHREDLEAAAVELKAKVQNSELAHSLPETCYGILASTGDVIIIKNGEPGYYRTDINAGSKEENVALVDELNAKAGISKAQRAAMEAGSMFGWHVPGANPVSYDENGKLKRDSLSDQIASAEQKQAAAETAEVEMSYGELCSLLRKVEATGKGHVSANIVFTDESFKVSYSERSRTYEISSNNKAFQSGMSGYSIFGYCLDGTDQGVRLEAYMAAEKGGKDGWKVERCYMSQAELNKANSFLEASRDTRSEEER